MLLKAAVHPDWESDELYSLVILSPYHVKQPCLCPSFYSILSSVSLPGVYKICYWDIITLITVKTFTNSVRGKTHSEILWGLSLLFRAALC